jgi:GntR family transcriptional regulator
MSPKPSTALRTRFVSGQPVHKQLTRVLESRVRNDLYLPGELIPSESKLCEEFGVSRITVRQALSDLVARGLLVRHQGRGTAVSPSFASSGPPASTGTLEDILILFAATVVASAERKVVKAPREVAQQLKIETGTPLTVLIRRRTLKGGAYSISRTYMSSEVAALITDEMLQTTTFIEALEKQLGTNLAGAHEVLWSTVADAMLARQLDVEPGAAVLALSLTYYAANGQPLAYTRTSIRGDRYKHHVRLGSVPVPLMQS